MSLILRLQALALQAVEALWRATRGGPSAVLQCPLEAILDYDPDALRALREILDKEMALLVSWLLTSSEMMRPENDLICLQRLLGGIK